MVVVMEKNATQEQIEEVIRHLKKEGLGVHISRGQERTVIGAIGDCRKVSTEGFLALPGVEKVCRINKPYKLAAREFKWEDTEVSVGGTQVGGGALAVIAGPCAVESREDYMKVALAVKEMGATMLRGGAYKPRTSPYSFQGLGVEGLEVLAEARQLTGLPVVTEVMDVRSVEVVARYADVLQVGARNMQNFSLLKEIGSCGKPVLLKRSPSATIEEWIMAAEYILAGGNSQVILCERGIRTFENYTRNTLDISAVPVVKRLTHLPVIVDPSHGTGHSWMVKPMCLAAAAAGCDGLMVEVHHNPPQALCDGPQSLTLEAFKDLMKALKAFCAAGTACGTAEGGTVPEQRASGSPDMLLAQLRREIDDVDRRIIELVAARANLVKKVFALKKGPIRDRERETQVLENAKQLARARGLPAKVAEGIFRLLINYSVRLQEDAKKMGKNVSCL